MLYTIRIFKSWGGRSSRGQWSNTYHINVEFAIDSPEMIAAVNAIANREKNFHLAQVHMMRAVVSTYQKEGRKGHPEAVNPIELAGVGLRAIPAGIDPLPLDVAFVIKSKASFGRSGQMKFRGVLLESDVVAGGQGNFTMPGPVNWGGGADLQAAIAGPPAIGLSLPGAAANGLPSRPITNFTNAGVLVQKTKNKRKKKTDVNEGNVLQYADEALGIVGAIAALYFTKGKAIEPLARAAAAGKLGGLGSLIGSVLQHLAELDLNPLDGQ